jgi:hypothetical protein
VGDSVVDILHGLNSIRCLASLDLCNNCMLISGRKLGWMASKRSVVVGKEIMKCSGNSRPANTKFGGNMTIGEAIRSKRKDIFLLSRGGRMHDELWLFENVEPGYIPCKHCLVAITHSL